MTPRDRQGDHFLYAFVPSALVLGGLFAGEVVLGMYANALFTLVVAADMCRAATVGWWRV